MAYKKSRIWEEMNDKDQQTETEARMVIDTRMDDKYGNPDVVLPVDLLREPLYVVFNKDNSQDGILGINFRVAQSLIHLYTKAGWNVTISWSGDGKSVIFAFR